MAVKLRKQSVDHGRMVQNDEVNTDRSATTGISTNIPTGVNLKAGTRRAYLGSCAYLWQDGGNLCA